MSDIKEIDIDAFAQAHASGALVIDVRETDEFNDGHVPGATSLPLSELQDRFGELSDNGAMLIICRSGGRSAQACQFLQAQGMDVTNIAGGTLAWIAGGRDVETGA